MGYSLRPESQQEVVVAVAIMIRSQFRTGVAGMTPLDVMWVGLGGGLGSLLRWLTGRVIGEQYHGDFPVGTSRGQRATMTTNLRHSAD